MTERKNPVISISNFGPINRARIELKPLTIFIGGHNTGKTYAAQLVYCLARVTSGRRLRWGIVYDFEKLGVKKLDAELKEIEKKLRSGKAVKFLELGTTLQKGSLSWWNEWRDSCKSEIVDSIRQYFLTKDVGNLVRFESEATKSVVSISSAGEGSAKARIRIGRKPRQTNVKLEVPSIEELSVSRGRFPYPIDYTDLEIMLRSTWRQVWKEVADKNSYYLPAARSGILQTWPMLQFYVLESLSEVGLPSLVKDFLSAVQESMMFWRGEGELKDNPALEILESEILHGKIDAKTQRPRQTIIDYSFGEGAHLSIQRASSMVAELAPLDLWVKNLLAKGDLLIIEEPEAHLHPSSQMQIARVITRLVNSGIRVICTTHSHLLLNRISNLMLASKASESVMKEIGLENIDLLREEDLAVYQFGLTDNGSVVKRLRMISKFGIPEDEFIKEYERISVESHKVSS